ncbi:hypothetical protein Tco_0769281 [Tanacetum coccineum]|uniref:Integrase, catalytic region, zinc finger, CCHC-type, peptidase aspartic, catalytic n=1 Tax=Tanacetum coccineum TaxID=301880 RepID=A0ABQ4Z9Z1_9ASTR
MTTLAEHIIEVGAENHPPMLEKSMYDSWVSRIRLFIKGKKHGRMMLDSIDNCPLVYPTVEEDGQTRPKKYSELTEAQQLQDDCDVRATNIILHGLPPDVYALVNHQVAAKDIWIEFFNVSTPQQFTPVYTLPIHHQQHHTPVDLQQQSISPQPFISSSVTQQSQAKFPQLASGLVVPTFQQREDLIVCINKAMAFLSVVASSFAGTGNKGIATTSRGNYVASQPRVVKSHNCQGEGHMKLMLVEAQEAGQILDEEKLAFIADHGIEEAPVTQQTNVGLKIPQNSAFQTKDLDAFDSDCDDISSAKAVLMVNLSSCDSDVLSEVPYSNTYPNDMINQDVQEMSYSKQTHIDDYPDNEINSDSNIISYSQYLQESQDAEQAFWLKHSNYNLDTSVKSHTPVRIEAPSELPKVSLVNESLKKLKYHLASFDKVVKKRTTSDAITADEITKVQTIFNQMEVAVDYNAHVKHSVRNAKFESICVICNKFLFDANHDMCLIDYVNDVNVHSKSKSKRNKMRKVWKPKGKVFSEIRYSWKPTERIFTIFRNMSPLTRIVSTKEVPLKETTITPVITPSSELKVYSRKPKASGYVGSSSKAKIVESKTSNTKEPKQSWGSTASDVPSSSLID